MSQNQMSPQMQAAIAKGPPYPSPEAMTGGTPNVTTDVPILSVFLFMYICSAATNMFIFQRNRIRGIFFIPTALLFGFSMARILTCTLRIVWATKQDDASTALAAEIFTYAGVLIIYIINLLFAQRILRALQPKIGWHRVARLVPRLAYALIGCCLILIIVFLIYGSYTLSESFHNAQKWILRAVSIYLLIFAAAPLVIIPVAFALPRSEDAEHFGEGSMLSKALIVMTTTCLCTLLAGFRAGTAWSPSRPANDPAWFDSKASFYCFGFMLEIIMLIIYTSCLMHKRFIVPDGSRKRKSYAVPDRPASESGTEVGDEDPEKNNSEDSGSAI